MEGDTSLLQKALEKHIPFCAPFDAQQRPEFLSTTSKAAPESLAPAILK